MPLKELACQVAAPPRFARRSHISSYSVEVVQISSYAMPNVSFFVTEDDVPVLIDRLNEDEEIAFLVRQGAATPQKRWFARFKAWMTRAAVKLESEGSREPFYAFPFALALLKRGVPYYARGFRLDSAIAAATASVAAKTLPRR